MNPACAARSPSFDPADPKAALAELPQAQAVFALYGAEARAEPYIGRTPNLRARLERLLQPSAKHPRRLHLAGLVRRIEWQLTGSEFESLLAQFSLLDQIFGAKAIERMHLRAPAFVRFLGSNPYPRITVTHRPSLREADWAYGPFPSRAAAERFSEEALKLFLLRRCTFDLCARSQLSRLRLLRDEDVPRALLQGLHATSATRKRPPPSRAFSPRAAKAVWSPCAPSATRPRRIWSSNPPPRSTRRCSASKRCAPSPPNSCALSAAARGHSAGLRADLTKSPSFSSRTAACADRPRSRPLGMRIQNEQSGSTSLFAQPMAIEPVPEAQEIRDQRSEIGLSPNAHEVSGHNFSRAESAPINEGALAPEAAVVPARIPHGLLESRLETTLTELSAPAAPPSAAIRQGHLALLKRWYYRPETRRAGEIFFPDSEDRWPIKSILRGVGRVAAKRIPL